MKTEKFNTTQLQAKIGTVLNSVQLNGVVEINNRSRPDIIIMLKASHDILIDTAIAQNEKIRQLTAVIKSKKL
jgi:prevent-host-death family protein